MAVDLSRFADSVTARLAVIAVLLLAMLIPLGMVEGLVRERGGERDLAAADIARSWGQAQTISGPVVVVPFRRQLTAGSGHVREIADELSLLPLELTIEGGVETQVLSRGIYQIPVYSASLSITGRLRPVGAEAFPVDADAIDWNAARIVLPLSDPRSLRNPVTFAIGTETLDLAPGLDVDGGATLTARLGDLDRSAFAAAQPFSVALTLAGTGNLSFMPDGDLTRVDLDTQWPSPSFRGAWLPGRRGISADGFEAEWEVIALGRGYPATWFATLRAPAVQQAARAAATFGVEFVLPVGVHSSTLRALKYAELFLIVTFAAFFMFEIFAGARLHPVNYLAVGLANAIFYLLLLALGEHAGFAAAYLSSAIASTALIGGYAAAILGDTRRALPLTGLIAALYLYLYTALRAEDYALVVGAVGLFALLTAFMYLTRGVDWYALELRGRPRHTGAARAE